MADAGFEAMWANVLSDWGNEGAHHALLEYAIRTELLGELAKRYRREKDNAAHAEYAAKRLEAVALTAMSMLEPTRAGRAKAIPKWVTFLAGLVCAILLGAVAKAFR